jgi:site-specific DNA recombinase
MTKRAVLYARVSGDDRAKEGRNLAGQLEMCRKYALDRGYEIIAELAEDERGARGADLDLDKLNRVLDMAERGEFDVLVVREMDRMARDTWKQGYITHELARYGVAIEFVLYDFPPTPEGDLQRHIIAGFAEYEAKKIAQRLARGRRGKVKEGNVRVGRHVPYGYQVVEVDGKTTLEICESEAEVVRLAFQWCAEAGSGQRYGPDTLTGICRRLNDLTANQARAPKWRRYVLHRIFASRLYIGEWHYGKRRRVKRIVDGKEKYVLIRNPEDHHVVLPVPPIVSLDVWKAVQVKLARNRAAAGGQRKYRYLLSGLLTCGTCGAKLSGSGRIQRGRIYKHYRCPAIVSLSGYTQRCDLPSFRANEVDADVWAWLKGWLADPDQLIDGLEEHENGHHDAAAPLREQIAVLDAGVAKGKERLDRLLDVYLSGDIDKSTFRQRKGALDEALQRQRARRRTLQAIVDRQSATRQQIRDLAEFAERIGRTLEVASGDFAAQREIVKKLNVQVMLRVVDGQREVRVVKLLDLDVFIAVPHVEGGVD